MSQTESNEGTAFWFGFMEHRDQNQNTKVALITSRTQTSGTIEIPLRNWSQSFTVQANEVTVVTLPLFTEISERIRVFWLQMEEFYPNRVVQYLNFPSKRRNLSSKS